MKKVMSVFLAAVFVFSCINLSFIPVNAITDYTTGVTENGISYSIDNETGELTVIWADFSTTDLVIPAYIDGRPVTTIGDNLLNDTTNPNLRSVVIPDTVTKIGFYAFGNCINLESVVMSNNIEYVEDYAFQNTALTNNTDKWENGALYIGKFLYGVLPNYSGEFVIKDGTKVIGNYCFSGLNRNGCERITRVFIPDTVVQIGLFAFYNCKGLTSIDIPESVRYIDNSAFGNCVNLSKINVNTSKLSYVGQTIVYNTAFFYDENNWQDDVLYLKTAALCGKTTITNLKLKKGTEIVADYAFACNDNIVSVSLPNSLRIICQLAFDDLHSLPSIALPDGLEYIANNAFDGCDLLTELDIPASVNYIGLFAFNRTDKLEKLIIRNPECTIIDNHEEYAGGAYSVNTNTTVYGEEGSTAETFANNNGVYFVPLFSESGRRGDCTWEFDNVSGTLSFKSLESYTQIYGYDYGKSPWFSFKDSIKTITADSNIYSIGANCFTDCPSLESVYMPGVYTIGDYAFEGCEQLKKVELSSEYIQTGKVGKYAFAFCSSLNKIVLPFNSLVISEKAFYCCENLNTLGIYTSYNYPEIGAEAFSNCSQLTSIYMLNNGSPFLYAKVSNNAFNGVNANVYYHSPYVPRDNNVYGGQFTYINMTAGIVGYDAFWDYDQENERLTITGTGKLFRYSSGIDLPWMYFATENTFNISSIIIEDGITEIPSYSFEYMDKVTSVSLPNTLLSLAPNAFRACESLTEITLPASLEYVDGRWYWYRCPNLNDVYYVGTEQEWINIYDLSQTSISERITPHFLVYHPATQTCTVAGYPAHYEFDGTSNTTFYDLNKVAIPTPEPDKLTHHFNGYWTKDSNSHWHTCTLCGTAISDKADHKFDNACDEICNICGYKRTIEHDYSTDYTSDENSHWRVCTVCGDKTDFGSHVWDEGKVTKAPSCTDIGIRTYTCSVCKKTRTEEIDATGHTVVIDKAKTATCTKTGLTEGSHCSVCGEIIKAQEIIPATGHTEVIDKGKAPTCTETGLTDGSHCSVCGEVIKAQGIIPAKGHTPVTDKGYPATLSSTGLTDGSHCSVCGKVLEQQKEIPVLEYVMVVVGSTSEIFGTKWDDFNYDNIMTENSDGSYTLEYTVNKAYKEVQIMVAKLSKEDYIRYGDENRNIVSFSLTGTGTFTVTATPSANGYIVSVAGGNVKIITDLEYSAVYAVGNGEGAWLNGVTWNPCDKNNSMTEISDDVWEIEYKNVSAGSHQLKFAIDGDWMHNFGGVFNNSSVVTDAVYNGDNILFETKGLCTVKVQLDLRNFNFRTKQGAKFTITIICYHDSIKTEKGYSADCTHDGLTDSEICEICGTVLVEHKVIPAKGHTEVIDKGKAPTCTETGLTDGSHCSVCGEIIKAQEVIPATGHTKVIDKGKAPTCTETGLTDGSHCSVCGEIIKAQEVIPATGHTWDNGTVTKAADCHHEGEMTYRCSECHEKRTEVIPMLEHQWDDGTITKEPTYTEPGEVKYTCSLCGDTRTEPVTCKEKKGKLTISNETVRAGNEVTVKLYLDENPGITALSININFPNEFILKDVQYMGLFPNQPSSSPMNYNPFTISWASPTSTDIDNTGLFAVLTFDVGIDVPLADYPITVTYNAENVFDSAFVNVPLDIENGTVSVLKPTPGDVNRDGNINMKDLVLIQQLINRWDVQIVESAADVTDDGEINMKDLVLLQRYINGWEVVLK